MWSEDDTGTAAAAVATASAAWGDRGAGRLLALRLLFATFMVGTGVLVVRLATPGFDLTGLLGALALMYASVGAAGLGRRAGIAPRRLAAWQLAADVVFVGLLCRFSGGAAAAFRTLYFVPILIGAHWFGLRGSLPLAAGAALAVVAERALGGAPAADPAAPGGPALAAHFTVSLLLLVGWGTGFVADRAARVERARASAAEELRRARVEVSNVLDNLSSGLLITDRAGRVTTLNPAAERILGVLAEEAAGRELEAAFGAALGGLTRAVREVLAGGPSLGRGELNIVRWDTVVVPLGLSVSHLRDAAGEVRGAIAVFQDLTEVQKMRERIREADRLAAVGQLSASIAHEIRNPLGSIRGSVEILAQELQLAGHQQRLLELILKESARVNTIINDFLSFARLRPPHRRPVPVGSFLEDVTLQVRQQVAFKGGGVQVETRVAEPRLAVALDAEQMTQLFLNLALNACEAMRYEGRLVLTADATADGGYCEFGVLDTGPGLSDEARENMFTPFFTTKKEGTGLGLPMVARIAHAHEGTIEAGTSPAGGAEFRVRIPVGETPAEAPGSAAAAPEPVRAG